MVIRFVIAVEDGLCSLEKPFLLQVRISFHSANEASKQLLLICLLKCNGKNKYRWQYLTVMLVLLEEEESVFYTDLKTMFWSKTNKEFAILPEYSQLCVVTSYRELKIQRRLSWHWGIRQLLSANYRLLSPNDHLYVHLHWTMEVPKVSTMGIPI